MNMAEKIKFHREQLGLTLEELGNRVGVGKSTVRKWETGMIANMRRDKIAKVATALNISPGYLMGWDDNPDPSVRLQRTLLPDEASLLDDYQKLNDLGKEKARSDVEDLTAIPKYTDFKKTDCYDKTTYSAS